MKLPTIKSLRRICKRDRPQAHANSMNGPQQECVRVNLFLADEAQPYDTGLTGMEAFHFRNWKKSKCPEKPMDAFYRIFPFSYHRSEVCWELAC